VRLTRLECQSQGHAIAKQVLLPNHLAQVARPQALGQGGMRRNGSGFHGHLDGIKGE
jgi:hypothetical protein